MRVGQGTEDGGGGWGERTSETLARRRKWRSVCVRACWCAFDLVGLNIHHRGVYVLQIDICLPQIEFRPGHTTAVRLEGYVDE